MPSTSHHNRWFHQSQVIGPPHLQKVKDPNRNLHLKIGFCEHYEALITIVIADTIGKWWLEWEYPFLKKFVSLMNNCLIQYKAPIEKYVNVTP